MIRRKSKTMSRFFEYLTLPMSLVLIGGILSVIGAFLATHRETEEKEKSANQRVKFEQELRSKTEEISELNKTIAATVTGGDSYCYFSPNRPNPKTNIVDLQLLNEGKYPLYDVQAKINDLEKSDAILKEGIEKNELPLGSETERNAKFSPATTVIQVGNITPSTQLSYGGLVLPATGKQSYIINITARNGYIVQRLSYRQVNGIWKIASQVSFKGNIVKEQIEADYPRDSEGKVIW